jgi:hypothetical protein
MLLNETNWWLWNGSEMTCKTDGETRVKHIAMNVSFLLFFFFNMR